MLPAERDFYLTQSVHSDPGTVHSDTADRLAELPHAPDELALLVRSLLIHREESGRFGCALPESRYREEAETRYISDILEIITRRDSSDLTAPRRPLDRFAGTCRDFALLHVALLRHTGTPARIRCGYATYFAPGFYDDHWITEYRHPERGWVLTDPQMVPDERIEQRYELDFDPLDVPRDRFLLAGQGWEMCRSGEAEPESFGVSVLGLTGLWMVRGNVLHDLAALNRAEVLPWDAWGLGERGKDGGRLTGDELTLLDEAARATRESDFARVRALYLDTPELRVPTTFTSYASFDAESGREVTLRGGRGRDGDEAEAGAGTEAR